MTAEPDMRHDYSLTLANLEEELGGLAERKRALEAAIAALRPLVAQDRARGQAGQESLSLDIVPVTTVNGARQRTPAIPPGFFKDKSPTQAYRDFIKLWPGDWKPPQIADAFEEGGMEKTRSEIISAVHSVLKRTKAREERQRKQQSR